MHQIRDAMPCHSFTQFHNFHEFSISFECEKYQEANIYCKRTAVLAILTLCPYNNVSVKGLFSMTGIKEEEEHK